VSASFCREQPRINALGSPKFRGNLADSSKRAMSSPPARHSAEETSGHGERSLAGARFSSARLSRCKLRPRLAELGPVFVLVD
jgi:hypothetical protein